VRGTLAGSAARPAGVLCELICTIEPGKLTPVLWLSVRKRPARAEIVRFEVGM
jgi:hypothetical protein